MRTARREYETFAAVNNRRLLDAGRKYLQRMYHKCSIFQHKLPKSILPANCDNYGAWRGRILRGIFQPRLCFLLRTKYWHDCVDLSRLPRGRLHAVSETEPRRAAVRPSGELAHTRLSWQIRLL